MSPFVQCCLRKPSAFAGSVVPVPEHSKGDKRMRRRLVTVTLVAAGACALGGLVGQSIHPVNVDAAAKKTTHAKTTSGTTRTHAGSRQTGTAATPHADGTVTAVKGNTITVKP